MSEDVKKPVSAAEPVKTPFEVASKHIPEGRASLLSRAIRQGLNDYGWKNFGTLPEVLMGYIVQAEKAEADAHPQKPRDCGHDGGDLSERRDNIGSAYTRSALFAQVQDVAVRKLEIAENAMRSTIMSGSIWKLEEALEEMEIIDLSDAAPVKQDGGNVTSQ
ncbi:hypothetical protein [Agrobacterium sp. 10MFCol1.1]|uniref:hypothetical protein n=1 Tax=Agrobacterium sp. 10MFCol1.1 TaxID=1150775 RepID=UPI0003698F08|nr:hypothetical protein [Agrobacterium sp. 10MFCol1.1]